MGPLPLIKCRGTHYEMGVQQGKAARELIVRGKALLREFLRRSPNVPRFAPLSLVLRLAAARYGRKVLRTLELQAAEQYQRLVGIAEGCGETLSALVFRVDGDSDMLVVNGRPCSGSYTRVNATA